MSAGIRCAETTSASAGTPNSSSTSTAACITGQSESLPMTTPTTGRALTGPLPAGPASPASTADPAGPADPSGPAGPAAGSQSRVLGSRGEIPGCPPGPLPDHGEIAAERGDMADLAPWPDGLAVKLHLHSRIGCQYMVQLAVQVRVIAAEHVRHHDAGRGRGRGAERPVQHGA